MYNRQGELVIYDNAEDDEQNSTSALVAPSSSNGNSSPPVANLKVKRVDNYYSTWSKAWKYRNSGSNINPEAILTVGNGSRDGNDPWQSYCFVVVRKIPKPGDEQGEPTFQVVVKSPYLLQACKDVIKKVQGVSWTAEPLELDPHLLLAFLPQFEQYRDDLRKKSNRSVEQTNLLKTVDILIDYLRKDYKATIAKVDSLTAHGEITYDTLFALFVPRTVVVTECPITGEPRAFQLVSATQIKTTFSSVYDLICESVDAFEDSASTAGARGTYGISSFIPAGTTPGSPFPYIPPSPQMGATGTDTDIRRASGKLYGRVQSRIFLPHFKGTVPINSLDVYPIKYHPEAGRIEMSLIERGKKWMSLRGIHHMQYDGPAAYTVSFSGCKNTIKHNVKSRIMIDRGSFRRLNPNYEMPVVKLDSSPNPNVPDQFGNYPPSPPPVAYNPSASHSGRRRPRPNRRRGAAFTDSAVPTFQIRSRVPRDEVELTEDELMLAPAVLYGFSLTDKTWLEFNIMHVQPIVWNDEAFANLVLPNDRKMLLQSLVEAHNGDISFDDFVHNKGRGLVVNLFGPPGVGKTLSAEATSEHVRQPLYVVGAGDLGTTAATLDQSLNRVFDIATSWKAIVLIDEADVFLEQRSLHDMERNAMVAVFLRHVEYYDGILFLTTNRVKAFDEAFLSRIHVALHFHDLTRDARRQVWAAFLAKVGVGRAEFGEHLLDRLAAREVNGRQIKNAVRTASSLAAKKGTKTGYADLLDTLDAVDEFTAEFAAIRAAAAVAPSA
ncbi:P-loop containing nucleoside triphosphate hydrolase protein [Trametes maxima]|nr:P-loop containing nucleoside triphosphate hydrolase protein [Trametes maxima]